MAALFPDNLRRHPPNTAPIAEMVELKLPFGQLRIPQLPGARGRDRSRAGCARNARPAWSAATAPSRRSCRPASTTSSDVICRMGYAGYFLIVADFTRFARDQRIAITVRGSAPGHASSPTPSASRPSTRSTTSCRSSGSSTPTA